MSRTVSLMITALTLVVLPTEVRHVTAAPEGAREVTINGMQLPDEVKPCGEVVRRRTFPVDGDALFTTLSRGLVPLPGGGWEPGTVQGDSMVTIVLPSLETITATSFTVSASRYPLVGGSGGGWGATLSWGGSIAGGGVVVLAMFLNPENAGWQIAGGTVQTTTATYGIVAAADGTAVIEDAWTEPDEPFNCIPPTL